MYDGIHTFQNVIGFIQSTRLIACLQRNQIATSACGLLAMTLYIGNTIYVICSLYVIARSRRFACDVAIWSPLSGQNSCT